VRELRFTPGFGVAFGSNRFATSPAISFRWDYERRWFVSQGLLLQSLKASPVFHQEEPGDEPSGESADPAFFVRPTITDGNHFSGRWNQLTVGATWEHIHFREGDEWKGGGRLAFRLLPRFSALFYVLGPGRAEWRGGFVFHSQRRD
jgi:hypothetical protein